MTSEVDRYRENLRDELNGAALYTALADAELDPVRKDLFLQLAQAEATHAQFWRDKLVAAGVPQPAFMPDFRTRLLARLARRFGVRFVLPSIAGMPRSCRPWRRRPAAGPGSPAPTSPAPNPGTGALPATTCARPCSVP